MKGETIISRTHRVLVLVMFVTSTLLAPKGLSPATAAPSATNLPPTKSFTVSPLRAAKLTHDGAILEIGADAEGATTLLSITPLAEQDLSTLDQGMANATLGPRCSYRFLPHGIRFKTKNVYMQMTG